VYKAETLRGDELTSTAAGNNFDLAVPNKARSGDQLKRVLAIVGDHSMPESAWLQACQLLGDYKHRPKTRVPRAPLVLLSLLAIAGLLGYCICQQVAETFISPPAIPPSISRGFAPPFAPAIRPVAPSPATAIADVDFGPYMASLQRRIKRHWTPPKGNFSTHAVVKFTVARDGRLLESAVDQSSGQGAVDQAALRAIADASPFRPLPPGAPDDVDIQFSFDYSVSKGSNDKALRELRDANGGVDAFSIEGASPSESAVDHFVTAGQ
jgi:TonB family protein